MIATPPTHTLTKKIVVLVRESLITNKFFSQIINYYFYFEMGKKIIASFIFSMRTHFSSEAETYRNIHLLQFLPTNCSTTIEMCLIFFEQ